MAIKINKSDVNTSVSSLAEKKLAGLRLSITRLEEFATQEDYDAVLSAIAGDNSDIKVRRVLGKTEGRPVPVQILSFHKYDRKNSDGSEDDLSFTYEDSDGVTHTAVRRKFWFKDVDGVQGFGTFPFPEKLGNNLKQGSQITLNLHLLPAGERILQVSKDDDIDELVYPVDCYYPAMGGGFNAFETTIETLTAIYTAARGAMETVKAPKAKTPS